MSLSQSVASTVYEILLVQKEIIFFKGKDLTQFVLMQLFLKHILKKSFLPNGFNFCRYLMGKTINFHFFFFFHL
jgi:hypothetical protein